MKISYNGVVKDIKNNFVSTFNVTKLVSHEFPLFKYEQNFAKFINSLYFGKQNTFCRLLG